MPKYVFKAAWYVAATRTMHPLKHIEDDLQDRRRELKQRRVTVEIQRRRKNGKSKNTEQRKITITLGRRQNQ